jgi:transcriptional regulator with XRE-family HTH domain
VAGASLGQRIRELRTSRRPRLTLRELGEALGYTGKSAEQTTWAWENERVQVPSADVPGIARALGVTICELYGVEEGHGRRKAGSSAGKLASDQPGRIRDMVAAKLSADWATYSEAERDLFADINAAAERFRARLLAEEGI